MASLKDLKNRIGSVKNTQQITKTMKMVAAAKVRRARTNCEAARPYAEKLNGVLMNLASNTDSMGGPLLLCGRENVKTVRFVLFGSDRGLCAGFNSNLTKLALTNIKQAQSEGKTIQIVCVGRKIRDLLKTQFGDLIIDTVEDTGKNVGYTLAEEIGSKLLADFESGKCDEVQMVYNKFVSMMTQEPTPQSLIPFKAEEVEAGEKASVEYEPEEEVILSALLPKNLKVQIFRALLEGAASEHAARMAAMDSATRNAGDMIKSLSLEYNRRRQAAITTELIEIISGAEAL